MSKVQELDFLLINPNNKKRMYQVLGESLTALEPPLFVALLASFLRQNGCSVKIIDADAENYDTQETVEKLLPLKPLVVGVAAIGINPSASSTPKMTAAGEVLRLLKEKSPLTKTFLFGIHPSALPERTLREEKVDFVLRGECFYSALGLLRALKSPAESKEINLPGICYLKKANFVNNGWGRLLENLDELGFAAWDLLPMEKYRAHNWHCFGSLKERGNYAVTYTGLGCPFNCSYCNIHVLYNGRPGIRFRSPLRIIQEIDYLVKNYKVRNLKIIDELFVLKEERVIELCDLLIKGGYNLNIWAYARVDILNEELLKKMKKAGFNWLCFGIESGNRKVRQAVAKGNFDQEIIRRAVAISHRQGIHVIGNFMFGLPEDNLETMQQTLTLAKELKCEYVNLYAAMAYPGSPLYTEALRQKLPLPRRWSGYAQLGSDALPLPTRYLNSSEVLNFRDRAFEEYYSEPSYLKMIEEKFGHDTVLHIRDMLKVKIERSLSADSGEADAEPRKTKEEIIL